MPYLIKNKCILTVMAYVSDSLWRLTALFSRMKYVGQRNMELDIWKEWKRSTTNTEFVKSSNEVTNFMKRIRILNVIGHGGEKIIDVYREFWTGCNKRQRGRLFDSYGRDITKDGLSRDQWSEMRRLYKSKTQKGWRSHYPKWILVHSLLLLILRVHH